MDSFCLKPQINTQIAAMAPGIKNNGDIFKKLNNPGELLAESRGS
jgi:hypothetical protein